MALKQTLLSCILTSFFFYAQATVYISEVMYNSPGADDEWIEICNDGMSDVDISTWDIVDDGNELFEFPAATMLLAGTCITIALGDDGDGDAFNDCGGDPQCFGTFTPDFNATGEPIGTVGSADNTLGNTSGTIEIRDATDMIQNSVSYMSSNGGSGNGETQKFDNTGTFVRASIATPGFQVSCSGLSAGDLIITEILVDETTGQNEWFEVYNNTMETINLVGLAVQDNSDEEIITSASAINLAAGEYAVISLGGSTGCGAAVADYNISSFGLSNSGDQVRIFCDGVLIDAVDFTSGFPIEEGEALNFDAALLDGSNDDTENDNAANWCLATTACEPGELGTPGTANISCNTSTCPMDLTDADLGGGDPNNIPAETYQASNNISSTGTVADATTVVFDAGNMITLAPGFMAVNGSTFTAMIGGCTPAANAIEERKTAVRPQNLFAVRIYPNPMQQQGNIAVELQADAEVSIQLFDLSGKLHRILLPKQSLVAGQYVFPFQSLTGTYFARIQLGTEVLTQKIIVLQ